MFHGTSTFLDISSHFFIDVFVFFKFFKCRSFDSQISGREAEAIEIVRQGVPVSGELASNSKEIFISSKNLIYINITLLHTCNIHTDIMCIIYVYIYICINMYTHMYCMRLCTIVELVDLL